jgi:hypothetical protein
LIADAGSSQPPAFQRTRQRDAARTKHIRPKPEPKEHSDLPPPRVFFCTPRKRYLCRYTPIKPSAASRYRSSMLMMPFWRRNDMVYVVLTCYEDVHSPEPESRPQALRQQHTAKQDSPFRGTQVTPRPTDPVAHAGRCHGYVCAKATT